MFTPALYMYLMSFLGTPYRWSGDDPMAGMDCSGVAVEYLQAAGFIPHKADYSSQGLYNLYIDSYAPKVPSFGDLVFYGKGEDGVSHVGVALDGHSMLEAAGGGRNTETLEDAIRQNAFVRIRPWYYRGDIVGIRRPDSYISDSGQKVL
jgi:cell wall-associated NlpC family hydrolase